MIYGADINVKLSFDNVHKMSINVHKMSKNGIFKQI